MVKVSYEQKPFRREVMRTYGASVVPSPSETTEVGKKILAEHPGTTGSLGCAISEAVEVATKNPGYRYVSGLVDPLRADHKRGTSVGLGDDEAQPGVSCPGGHTDFLCASYRFPDPRFTDCGYHFRQA